MIATIKSSTIHGMLSAPTSKSAMQRACAAALLTNGTSIIHNPGKSNDDKAAIHIIEQLGAAVITATDGASITIISEGIATVQNTKATLLDCGESGLSLRMFTPIAALAHHAITITGHGSLNKRPMHFFESVLPTLSVKITAKDACIPLQIQGPLVPKNIIVNGSQSSQYITGLLMAYAAATTEDASIKVNQLHSKPYVELTLAIMQQFQMNLPDVSGLEVFDFHPATNEVRTIEYTVEGDWSSAAFLLVAAAINGDITITGLNTFSTQADAAILDVLEDCNADISIDEDDAIHVKSAALTAFEFDATDSPDLFPPLVALACFCTGTSIIKGVHRLQHKESNREQTLIKEFRKLGIEIKKEDDALIIAGQQRLQGAKVTAHNDHRIAMSLAIMGLNSENLIEIEDAASVDKSYPDFWKDLAFLGADIAIQ